MSSISGLGEDEISSFFESSPPLKNKEEIEAKLNQFIELNSSCQGEIRVIYINVTHLDSSMIYRVFIYISRRKEDCMCDFRWYYGSIRATMCKIYR